MSKYLWRSLMIFIIKGFRTIVFIFIFISTTFRPICPPAFFRCLSMNFCDKAWWFLSLRVFGLLSSSLFLFPQRFGRYVLRPSSGVCRWIFVIKLDDFYHKGFSDYSPHLYCYFHNVSADMSSGLLQVFVELGDLHWTSNYVLYWIQGVTCSDFVSYNRVQMISIPVLLLACSPDWTCNLQMIVSLEL